MLAAGVPRLNCAIWRSDKSKRELQQWWTDINTTTHSTSIWRCLTKPGMHSKMSQTVLYAIQLCAPCGQQFARKCILAKLQTVPAPSPQKKKLQNFMTARKWRDFTVSCSHCIAVNKSIWCFFRRTAQSIKYGLVWWRPYWEQVLHRIST